MIELYEHNRAAYQAVVEMLQETGKAAVIHPTGSGKSFIGFKLCEDNPEKTVLWLSPSEYIFQTQLENLRAAGGDTLNNIRFLTYTKLMRMSEAEIAELKPGIIICDEFHRVGAERWQTGVDTLRNLYPNAPLLGLSATAVRYLDNQRDMASELFDGCVASQMTLGETIARGILNPPKYITAVYSYQKALERYQRKVRRVRNQKQRSEAEKYLEALRRALDKADGLDVIFQKHMTDVHGKYIVFCANKEHMDEMMSHLEWFRLVDEAPRVYSVYAYDPAASESFDAFKNDTTEDHLRLLYCIDALNEGIHVEGVSGVILLRPTISPIIYKQQIGRALSASKSKEPVIFDIVNNVAGLYSIQSIQDEMQEFLRYNQFLGQEGKVINERFTLIDTVENCRQLFDELEDTLSASWDYMYLEAKEYYKENGNLLPPYDYVTPDGAKLGQWVVAQRVNYRNGTGISQSRIDRLNAIGMNWRNKNERQWDKQFRLAEAYYAAHGDLLPTQEKEPSLSDWLSHQRVKQREGLLSDEQIERLSSLGMVWEFDDSWDEKYALAKAYYEKHGDLNIPASYVTGDGTCLGTWCRFMRCKNQNGTLTEERRRQLDAIGMRWEPIQPRTWEQYYDLAKLYYKENGNLRVPRQYATTEGVNLGFWIAGQRKSKKKNLLTENQIRLLDGIGMIWNGDANKWDVAYESAKLYYKRHSDLNVPSWYKTEAGFCLGAWVRNQRAKYVAGKLKPMQIKRLEALQIVWKPYEDAWQYGFEHAKAYYDAQGDLIVPQNYVASDGFRLGTWINTQRTSHGKGTLTEAQTEKMEKIGMYWNVPRKRWLRGYEHAKAYFEVHGNLDVPNDFVCEDGYALGNWISRVRSERKNDQLAEEKIKMLCQIGMSWYAQASRWNELYEVACDYFQEHGDLAVPGGYKAADGRDLRMWLRSQRQKYRDGTLPKDRIQKLEQIGMQWNTANRHRVQTKEIREAVAV